MLYYKFFKSSYYKTSLCSLELDTSLCRDYTLQTYIFCMFCLFYDEKDSVEFLL